MAPTGYPTTPDGRYFVVRGRLWRTSNPELSADQREVLVKQLMDARRALRTAGSQAERHVCVRRLMPPNVDLANVGWSGGPTALPISIASSSRTRHTPIGLQLWLLLRPAGASDRTLPRSVLSYRVVGTWHQLSRPTAYAGHCSSVLTFRPCSALILPSPPSITIN